MGIPSWQPNPDHSPLKSPFPGVPGLGQLAVNTKHFCSVFWEMMNMRCRFHAKYS